MSVTDRLGRLLFIVPYVAHRDGVPLAELAEKLGVTTRQIEADLDLLSMVGQPPLTPDHLIDLYVEDDIVYVDLDQSLSRPLHLTHEEARALVLGTKLVGDLGGLGEEVERVLAKIIAHLNPVDQRFVQSLSQRVAVKGSADDFDVAPMLRQAINETREVEVSYYSASSDRQKVYRLKPLALLTHSGVEYLVALDAEADDQEKLFRLDRLGALRKMGATFVPPERFDLEKFRTQRLYFGNDDLTAEVRLAPTLARQMRERFAPKDVRVDADGSARVTLSTSSPAWLARWVLTFGSEAEVLAPAAQRAYLRQLCAEAAAAYEREL